MVALATWRYRQRLPMRHIGTSACREGCRLARPIDGLSVQAYPHRPHRTRPRTGGPGHPLGCPETPGHGLCEPLPQAFDDCLVPDAAVDGVGDWVAEVRTEHAAVAGVTELCGKPAAQEPA